MFDHLESALLGVRRAILNAEVVRVLTQPPSVICRSLVHMHFNRLWGRNGEVELEMLRLLRRAREQIEIQRLQRG
jgi:hypothetical protein